MGVGWVGVGVLDRYILVIIQRLLLSMFYSSPCILRLPLQPLNFGLKLKVVLNWRDIGIENIRMVSLIAGLKIEGIVKWRGLKSQGPLYNQLYISESYMYVKTTLNINKPSLHSH